MNVKDLNFMLVTWVPSDSLRVKVLLDKINQKSKILDMTFSSNDKGMSVSQIALTRHLVTKIDNFFRNIIVIYENRQSCLIFV